ncbi:ATP-dependent helicase [Nesterenkonia sp. CL21]|uniref:ATP-dependent helicase n=1 Tax=Nesterenkonia sp. CL21 TaxID=3064894 RepID=UPI0028789194|nr:ATP-dependent helicase [Nesterenkonia sp. CL21]MDS2173619.1 ATP-dependent helicase [Nesterenkonia sp. CL21]
MDASPDLKDALAPFTAPTREWFTASFGAPTAAQAGAWDAVSQGRHALVVAPTGSGKTLSAFLWSVDRLFAEPAEGTTVLYISPLKALGVDIERNLRSPLVGIAHTARRLGEEPAEITVGVRTGDSTSKQRRDLVRRPPNILITTPESLYLMLTSQARQTLTGISTVIVDEVHALAGTKRGAHLAVSLERLDDLLDSPAQRIGLSATVEPREEVARFLGGRQPVEIVAPPAEKQWDITVSVPVEDLANPHGPLPGQDSDGADWAGLAELPDGRLTDGGGTQPLQPSVWPHVEHRIVDLVASRRSTIVFVNSRRLAEKLTGRLNEIWHERQQPHDAASDGGGGGGEVAGGAEGDDAPPPDLARSHHGSVSKEQRKIVEEDLKAGRLRCVVATSSLELGIDMGAVDLVIQVEAPHAVSSGLQRIGRAGHQVGEVSMGWFFPKHRGDLVSTAVVVERMLAGQIEALHIPRNPLDVLAQQTVAAVALDSLDVEHWFETLRRSAPFSSLPRSAYEATLDLLAGKYPSDRFAELRPRIVWDRDAGTLTGRPGAQRLAVTSGGTIPDRGLFGVYLAGGEESGSARTGGRRVGELDEEMVYESRVGDVFALGATSWRIEEITFDRVLVTPAFGQPASLPFWRGDGLGRPAELGEALGRFHREVHTEDDDAVGARLRALGMDLWARENLIRYLAEQQEATGTLPSDTALVVEQTRDELGDWRIILHSPYGMQVHAPWALAVGERLHERYGLDGSALASDDGIVLRVPMMDDDPPGAELFRFEPEELEEVVTAQVSSSALFAGRFREAAARALLLPRQNPGQRTPLWQQRQRSSQLLEVASGHPDFPMIMEAMREVLQDVYDMPALLEVMGRIGRRRIRMVEATTQRPSPFAQSILFGYIAQYLYEGDSPLAERRAAALSVDPELLGELLGRVELRDFLDAGIIADAVAHAQRLAPSRRLRGKEGAADLLRLLGPLSAEELAARLRGSEAEAPAVDDEGLAEGPEMPALDVAAARDHAESLVGAQRAFRVRWRGTERYAAVEDASRLRDGLGVPLPPGIPQVFLDPVEDPLEDLVSRYARTHGPFTTEEAAAELGLGAAVVAGVLERLADQARLVRGLFRPDVEPDRMAPGQSEWCEVEMLRRIRRRSLAALRAEVEPVPPRAFAQFLAEWQSVTPQTRMEGQGALTEVLAQLSGVAAPASAWEAFILPARIRDYRPSMLDELVSAGEVVVAGRGALSGHDGWVALHPREDAEAGLLVRADHTPTALQRWILEILDGGGAWFPEALADQLARRRPAETADARGEGGIDAAGEASAASDGEPVSTSAEKVSEALWELFWAGRVVPDSFSAIRGMLTGGRTAHKATARPTRSRHTSRRMALRQAVEARRSLRGVSAGARTPGGRGAPGQPAGVRWSSAPGAADGSAAEQQTTLAYARAEILLDRYGVVTRGSVLAEQQTGSPGTGTAPGASSGTASGLSSERVRAVSPLSGGFAAVYKVLAAAEDAGQVRRGYFIEQLGAAQFTTSATIDSLRATADALEDRAASEASPGPSGTTHGTRSADHPGGGPRSAWEHSSPNPVDPETAREVLVLAATDPANAYGAALDWPALEDSRHRPGRKAGAVVVLHRGELLLYMERGGRTLLVFTEEEHLLEAAAQALVERLRQARTGRVAVERVNGQPVLGTRLGDALRRAGFHSSPSGLRFSG